eukprot:13870034-Alexandrium_andersonii.AAC.1
MSTAEKSHPSIVFVRQWGEELNKSIADVAADVGASTGVLAEPLGSELTEAAAAGAVAAPAEAAA